jgi:hypothetical protein
MHREAFWPSATAAVLALCVSGSSCNQSNEPTDRVLSITRTSDDATVTEIWTRTSEGATLTEIRTTAAVVSAVDKPSRSVTLSTPEGQTPTFKAGDEVRNFDQFAVGDQVTAQIWRHLVAYQQNGDPTSRAEGAPAAGQLPKGARSGGFMAAPTEQTATVVALDRDTRQATLQYADGKWRSLQVGQNLDLARIKVGDKLFIHQTSGAAILVQPNRTSGQRG